MVDTRYQSEQFKHGKTIDWDCFRFHVRNIVDLYIKCACLNFDWVPGSRPWLGAVTPLAGDTKHCITDSETLWQCWLIMSIIHASFLMHFIHACLLCFLLMCFYFIWFVWVCVCVWARVCVPVCSCYWVYASVCKTVCVSLFCFFQECLVTNQWNVVWCCIQNRSAVPLKGCFPSCVPWKGCFPCVHFDLI